LAEDEADLDGDATVIGGLEKDRVAEIQWFGLPMHNENM
jgi:hypothetical protein